MDSLDDLVATAPDRRQADLPPAQVGTGPDAPLAGGLSGRSIFLSYNRENARDAMRLRDTLRDEGLDVFMDSVHLIAGESWLQRLKQEVAQAQAVVVLIRPEGLRGFVLDELGWALERHHRAAAAGERPPAIFPVSLGSVPDLRSLDPRAARLLDFQVTAWQADQPVPVGLLVALRAALPASQVTPQRCPFRGLAVFEEADAEWFFGRLRETHDVIDSLGSAPASDGRIDRGAPGHHRYVLLSGDSGSGKSSLMRAGVLPRLRLNALWPRTGLAAWQVAGPMRPGAQPVRELATALANGLGGEAAELALRLGGDKAALAALVTEKAGQDGGVLLVVDQMEELLQPASDGPGRRQFAALLAAALSDASCPLYVLGTVRADALAEIDALMPDLVEVRNHVGATYTLPRISDVGLRLSIEEPSRRAGIDVGEVAELILAEAHNEPGALALVQHAMWSLWQTAHRRGTVSRLLRSDHEAAGGLAGMLSRDADAALDDVKAAVGSTAGALRLLLRLTWVGAEDRLFRRRLPMAEAELEAGEGDRARGERVIALMSPQLEVRGGPGGRADATDAGRPAHLPLLVTGQDDAGGIYVELVHEMLLRTRDRPGEAALPHWQRLYDHIQVHLQELKLAQRLQADVLAWRAHSPWQRWRRLASFKEQRQYALLPPPTDPLVRRYLALSRTKTLALSAATAAPVAWLGVGSAFVLQTPDVFPINYAVQLPLWAMNLGTEPTFVRLPGDRADFDLGCDPARDSVGPMRCGAGFLPLQRGLSRPITCDMGRHEVSFEQYDRFVFSVQRAGGTAPPYPAPAEKRRGDLPVMEVSRADAQAYADWLTVLSGGKHRYRLPQEWEWEYAARAGSTGPYPWGSASPAGRANHDDGSATPAARAVHSGEPNAFGLYNVVGNASEWVADDADPANAGAPRHVWRGGSFNQGPALVRLSARQSLETDLAGDLGTSTNIGFRLCRER